MICGFVGFEFEGMMRVSNSPLSKTLPIFLPKISSIILCLLSPLMSIDKLCVYIFAKVDFAKQTSSSFEGFVKTPH